MATGSLVLETWLSNRFSFVSAAPSNYGKLGDGSLLCWILKMSFKLMSYLFSTFKLTLITYCFIVIEKICYPFWQFNTWPIS